MFLNLCGISLAISRTKMTYGLVSVRPPHHSVTYADKCVQTLTLKLLKSVNLLRISSKFLLLNHCAFAHSSLLSKGAAPEREAESAE